MEQQTFRASNLVNNLLDLIANRPRSREIVNIEDLITATVALHEDLCKPKRITVHLQTVLRHGDEPPVACRGTSTICSRF